MRLNSFDSPSKFFLILCENVSAVTPPTMAARGVTGPLAHGAAEGLREQAKRAGIEAMGRLPLAFLIAGLCLAQTGWQSANTLPGVDLVGSNQFPT